MELRRQSPMQRLETQSLAEFMNLDITHWVLDGIRQRRDFDRNRS